jgi:hypothetical protein
VSLAAPGNSDDAALAAALGRLQLSRLTWGVLTRPLGEQSEWALRRVRSLSIATTGPAAPAVTASLAALTGLTHLELRCQLHNQGSYELKGAALLAAASQLPALASLSLGLAGAYWVYSSSRSSGCGRRASFSHLLPGLQQLAIINCAWDAPLLAFAASCPGLEDLRLVGDDATCHVTDAGLRQLAQYAGGSLRRVALEGCDGVTEAGVACLLGGMSRLERLDVVRCRQVAREPCRRALAECAAAGRRQLLVNHRSCA